ncbi:hypothetical protein CVT24_000792 [Panaeolus cyanescens]|uniref:Pentacotripeptide-repeat region of PRORP domain-containing protein n=1 Tax=Panaeolus cyanescens TaxID=181874 RepID=A0A409YCN3_9AGAR|nr:hypothetical protein CVT24_000792 [Panaeolus cyanescens]
MKSGPSDNNSADFPIDVFDAQSSFRRFCTLIEEDKQEEAKIIMRDAVEAAPTQTVLDQFKQVLLRAPQKNNLLIVDLASIYASKGYHQLVKDHLLPVLQQISSPDALKGLNALLSAPSTSPQAESVFEDLSVDYQTASSTTAAPRPSVMDLVKKSLPELLPEIPQNDAAIFEEDSNEYAFTSQASTHTQNSISSGSFLLQLVEQNQFDKAYHLLRELRELGTSIPMSPSYKAAITASITSHDLSVTEQHSRILAWLPLLPDAEPTNPCNIKPIIRHLNNMPTTNLKLLADFAIIMAGKGYTTPLMDCIFPIVIRYSKFEIGQEFLKNFHNAYKRFQDNSQGMVQDKGAGIGMHIYSTAIRTLARARRGADAVALFSEAISMSIRITKHSLDILVSQLQNSGQTELLSKVQDLHSKQLWNEEIPVHSRRLMDLDNLMTSKRINLTSDLAVDLLLLQQAVVSKQLPAPKDIANFMYDYANAGPNDGLTLLLQKALDTSFLSSNILLFAEMMLYHSSHRYDLILETFVDHFQLAGIPREEVLNQHRRIVQLREKYIPSPTSPTPPLRIVSRDKLVHPRGKLWPTVDHCNFVWAALVYFAKSEKTLERLYIKLLRFAEAGKDELDGQATASASSLMAPLPHETRRGNISSMAFTPFIRPMMRAFGEKYGVKILRDMTQLGLRPTIYHYTELAAFYSSKGFTEKAFLVLDHLEQHPQSDDSSTASLTALPPTGTSIYDFFASQKDRFPAPDLACYVALIRGFIISRHAEAATEVARRLSRSHKYVPGEDSFLDAALVHLRELQVQGNAWVPTKY